MLFFNLHVQVDEDIVFIIEERSSKAILFTSNIDSFQGQLSLQKLWFYVQPCLRTMEILSSIVMAIDKVLYDA